eukprot:TRINITY_DN11653_c0_g1_i1.p1 TRINITY_DN11653_c0_g1~~TRINITY_DN11653_c0_g1_i1.p1  ORF type:complete len:265 (+),score=23.03 TRINITY_DN11653_c0_g1_i1:130-924(+)
MQIFLSAALVLLATYSAHAYSCTYSWNGNNYDASRLANSNTDYHFQVQTTDFWMNVCRPTVTQVCGSSSATCQQWDPNSANGHASLGNAGTATFTPPSVPGENGQGFTLQFTGGDKPPGQNNPRTMEIDFICDSAAGVGAPSYAGEQPALHYNFQWRSAFACAGQSSGGSSGGSSGSSSGGSSTGGGATTKGGLSGGSVFLIILLCCVVVYVGAGIAWNHFKMHNTGVELIPNVSFWTSIPGLVKDGALFIWGKIARRDGYSSV